MPLFLYALEEIKIDIKPATYNDVKDYMKKIMDKMQLATECIIICLIYLEKVIIQA
jgi:hypothetical protein